MKKTVDVNIAGIAYKLDEDAFEAFNKYLNDISSRLAETDREEVLEDVEARVAELLNRQILLSSREVVSLTMIQTILAQIGSPEAFGERKRPTTVPRNTRPGMSPILKVILICAGLVFGAPLIFALFILFIVFGSIGIAMAVPASMFLCVLAVVVIPVYALIHTIVTFIRDRKGPGAKFWVIILVLWLLSIGGTAWIWHHSNIQMSDFTNLIDRLEDLDDDNFVDYDEYVRQQGEEALPTANDSVPTTND
jgi:hypothetical protein